MTELLNLIGNPYFWGLVGAYWVFAAAVGAMPTPKEIKAGPGYVWLYKFLNTLAANVKNAVGEKVPGVEGGSK